MGVNAGAVFLVAVVPAVVLAVADPLGVDAAGGEVTRDGVLDGELARLVQVGCHAALRLRCRGNGRKPR